jgi:uncharacterized membrane protein YbhN (UPF0104 family)
VLRRRRRGERARLAYRAQGLRLDSQPARRVARFATGSLVNSLLPARAGTAVRIALFSRTLTGEGRLLTAGGASVATGAARAFWTAVVVAAAALAGGVPAWPAAIAALLAAGAAAAVVLAPRLRMRRLSPLLEAFAAIRRRPARAARLVGWCGLVVVARLAAAASVASAVGIESPFVAALLVVAAVDAASALPLTPGNLGVAAAAIALVLRSSGASGEDALAVAVAFTGLETLTSIAVGTASVLALVVRPRLRSRPRSRPAAVPVPVPERTPA